MLTEDRTRFITLMTGIADYYGKELSDAVLRLYWRGLRQFEYADVDRALWEHTQNPDAGQYLPKIADVTRTLQGRTQDQAATAWSKVDLAIRTIGTYVDVVFDDALIHRVVTELGGWIWLGKQADDEWPFVAKRFENLYRAYRSRAETPPYLPQLTGIANAHNALEGREPVPPMLFGDLAKALRVHQGGSSLSLAVAMQPVKAIAMQNMALLSATVQSENNLKDQPDNKEAA